MIEALTLLNPLNSLEAWKTKRNMKEWATGEIPIMADKE